jgi:hypothetical protein
MRSILAAVILSNLFSRCAGSLSTLLESGTEECFIIRAPSDAAAVLTGNFDCLDDGLISDPISATLVDVDGNMLWTSPPGASEAEFDLHVTRGGRFTFCLKNGVGNMNDNQDRTIGFMVRVRPPSRAMDGSEVGPDGERALQLVEWASDLTEGWETLLVSSSLDCTTRERTPQKMTTITEESFLNPSFFIAVKDHYDYLRSREAVQRDLVEATLGRVVRWTVLEAVLLIGIAFVQVLFYRKFFEKKHYL